MNIEHFPELIKHASSILKLSHVNIENKYVNYPIYIKRHIENGVREDTIEIRFDEQEATLSATFDNDNHCDCVILFTDKIEGIDELIIYLNDKYDYDFLKSSWILSNCYISVKEHTEGIKFTFGL